MVRHGRLPAYGPLSVSPFSGTLQGAIIGAIFGAGSLLGESRIPPGAIVTGWILGGSIVGFVSGLLAPAFRYRIRASAVVWLAITVALLAVTPYWRLVDWLFLPWGAIPYGAFGAVIYAFVGWEYVEPDPTQPPRRSRWPDIVRALLRRMRSRSRPAS